MFRSIVVLVVGALALAASEQVGRVVDGSDSNISAHPYQVSIRFKNCDTCAFQHRCGAIIYSNRVLISSANCVSGVNPKRLHAVAGSSSIVTAQGVVAPVAKYVVHEKYDSIYIDYDISVIVLGVDLPFRQNQIQPIQLARELPKNGTTGYISGWGSVEEGGDFSDILKVSKVELVSDADCRKAYGQARITESMLCAGVLAGGADSCKGDSGGPLVVDEQLVGIVSWGKGCGRQGYPGVYTNVVALREWIESTVLQLN